MKVTVIPIVIDALGTITKGLLQGLEDMKIRERVKTIQDHPKTIAEIGQKTKKSPGGLRRLAVTYTRGKPSANADEKNTQ